MGLQTARFRYNNATSGFIIQIKYNEIVWLFVIISLIIILTTDSEHWEKIGESGQCRANLKKPYERRYSGMISSRATTICKHIFTTLDLLIMTHNLYTIKEVWMEIIWGSTDLIHPQGNMVKRYWVARRRIVE